MSLRPVFSDRGSYVYMHIYPYFCMCIYVCMHIYACNCMYAYMYVHIHKQIKLHYFLMRMLAPNLLNRKE